MTAQSDKPSKQYSDPIPDRKSRQWLETYRVYINALYKHHWCERKLPKDDYHPNYPHIG